jgi:hypothetical protein
MAFVRKNLERVAGGVQKLFMYNAGADTGATAAGSGYFNEVADEVDAGDVILVKGGSNATIDPLLITSARGVTPVTTVGAEAVA